MGMSSGEARLLRIKEALGAHLQADAYRDTFPDDAADAAYLRKQETYWRLKARQWLLDADARECLDRAKARAMDEPEHKSMIEKMRASLAAKG